MSTCKTIAMDIVVIVADKTKPSALNPVLVLFPDVSGKLLFGDFHILIVTCNAHLLVLLTTREYGEHQCQCPCTPSVQKLYITQMLV